MTTPRAGRGITAGSLSERLTAVAHREDLYTTHGAARFVSQHSSGHLDESRARSCVTGAQNGLVTAPEPGHKVSPRPNQSRSPARPAAAVARASCTISRELAFPTSHPTPLVRLIPAARLLSCKDHREFQCRSAVLARAVREKQGARSVSLGTQSPLRFMRRRGSVCQPGPVG